MLADLNITLIQADLHWCDPEKNRQALAETFDRIEQSTDLVVLPEMFTTGFTMAPETYAEPEQGQTLAWMQVQANRLDAAIVGSLPCQVGPLEDLNYRNRLWFVRPNAEPDFYDKRHLFSVGSETEHYEAGQERSVVEWRGWNILLTICYDLRFPVFCRNTGDYDLMLCVANWPAPRRHPWMSLLTARAIENQAYVAGVNRVGTEPSGLSYSGDTMLVDFKGITQAQAEAGSELVLTERLDGAALTRFREKFNALADADRFDIHW